MPPLIQLETKVIQDKTDKPGGFAALMLPGMLYMAVFFIAGGLATDVWRERTSGRCGAWPPRRQVSRRFLAGKLLAVLLVLALVGAFGFAVAHFLADLQISNFPLAVLWIALSGCGLVSLHDAAAIAASTERVASMLSNFVLLPLTMLGGSFFPFDLMPHRFRAHRPADTQWLVRHRSCRRFWRRRRFQPPSPESFCSWWRGVASRRSAHPENRVLRDALYLAYRDLRYLLPRRETCSGLSSCR